MHEYTNYYDIEDFPAECIAECSAPGDCQPAVEDWLERVHFDPDPIDVRSYLKDQGAWTDDELTDDDENRKRAFWIMCCTFDEWDGTMESPCGSNFWYPGP